MCRTLLVLLLVFVACVYETSSQWKMDTDRYKQQMWKDGTKFNEEQIDLKVKALKSERKNFKEGITVPSGAIFYVQDPTAQSHWKQFTFEEPLDRKKRFKRDIVLKLKSKHLLNGRYQEIFGCVSPSDVEQKLNDGSAQIRINHRIKEDLKNLYINNKMDGKKMEKPNAGTKGKDLKFEDCPGGNFASEQYWNEYDDEDFGDSNAVDSERESDRDMIFPMMISVMMGIAGCCIVVVCCTALGMLFGFVIGYSVYANDKREREPESIEVAVAN